MEVSRETLKDARPATLYAFKCLLLDWETMSDERKQTILRELDELIWADADKLDALSGRTGKQKL